jgi:acetylornithine deacetylase/succinyl-diaminopimelate desuccinylase-like protein
MSLEKVYSLIENRKKQAIKELGDFIAIPSVSAKEQALPEAAEFTAKYLSEKGFETKIHDTDGGPVVTAWIDVGADKTLMFYDHADVQPAEPFELWDSPPFELDVRDGKIYGRGVADNKGEIIVRANAVKAWLDAGLELPCNIKFIIETEEESSSKSLPKFVEKDKKFFENVDGMIWEFGGTNQQGIQEYILGVKGILYVQLSIKKMNRDAHSGNAPFLPNAGERLLQAISILKDENNKVLIPNFYDNVQEISSKEKEAINSFEFYPEKVKKQYGIDSFRDNLANEEAKKALFTEPTCNLCGFTTGWQGEGGKTVIPKEASAKIDFRLVVNQDPDKILKNLRKYLDQKGFTDVCIDWSNGYPPYKTPVDEEFVKICSKATKIVYNQEPSIQSTSGGSGPMYLFGEFMPIVSLGSGHAQSNAHSPNENIKVEDFIDGMKCIVAIIDEFKKW